MRTIYKNKRVIMIFMACCLVFSYTLQCMEVHAAYAAPVIQTPFNNQEIICGNNVFLTWSKPSGSISHYLVNVRLLYQESEEQNTLIISNLNVQPAAAGVTIYASALPLSTSYRASVCAVYSDGTKKYSPEVYFYVSVHGCSGNFPISMKIWTGFTYETKEGVYYAAQRWNNALDNVTGEIVNTYPYSQGHPTNEYDTEDNISAVTGETLGYAFAVAECTVGMVQQNGVYRPVEIDINLNKFYRYSNGAQSNAYDAASMITHEMGHAFGLVDKYWDFSTDWTMYGEIPPNTIDYRSLHNQDRLNLNQLYS